jgi:hypothetical protein
MDWAGGIKTNRQQCAGLNSARILLISVTIVITSQLQHSVLSDYQHELNN